MKHSILFTAVFILAALAQYNAYADGGPTQAELNAAGESTEWLLPNHDYGGQRFVDLKQITRQNAAELRPVCVYEDTEVRPFQTNPLVYKGVMYVNTPSSTMALDAATCALRWRHDWQVKARNAEVKFGERLANPYRSRGVALSNGKLIRSTSDGYLIALEIDTGKLVWEKHVAEAEKYELMIMAPLVYEDLIISGIGISEYGVKGWIGAFRLSDGEPYRGQRVRVPRRGPSRALGARRRG